MLPLPLFRQVREVLCLGAHCDDIEIGCGATLVELAKAQPDCRIRCVVMSGDSGRAAETRAAMACLLPGVQTEVQVHGFRDGFLPAEWADLKSVFEKLKDGARPDLVFTHYGNDRHQDHRAVSDLTWNTFRDPLILEYEIPKWDGDLGHPEVFVPASREAVDFKISAIMDAFVSQRGRAWFDPQVFAGLMRLRGMECNAPGGYAEAFYARKLVVS